MVPSLSRRSARAFSLVEMLVALVVLTLVVTIVAQITNGARKVLHGTGRMDADTESRLLFNRMALDFGRMLKRGDIDYSSFKQPAGTLSTTYGNASVPANPQAGNDQCAFYAETSGYFSGGSQPTGSQKSPIALVAYMIANDPLNGTPGLRRMGKGIGWEPSPGWLDVAYLPQTLLGQWPALFGADADYKTVGSQTFRIEYAYFLKSTSQAKGTLSITPWNTTLGHASIEGFKDVAAIVVTIAVLDNDSRRQVLSYTALTQALPDAKDGQDVAAAWSAIVGKSSFASIAGIPIPAAAQVRVYERYFYLNTLEESTP